MENHKCSSLNAEGKPVLDSLVLCFLQNINILIAVEKLVRTRRATLMNWKVLFSFSNCPVSYFFSVWIYCMQVCMFACVNSVHSNLESYHVSTFS